MEKLERFKRQTDIINPDLTSLPIHLIGCGGIGSWTALMLAKMGCDNITIYDFDEVEDHNVASQFFKESQLGKLKTEALLENVLEQTGIRLMVGEIEEEKDLSEGIIIIAVDSMKMRWRLNEYYKNKNLLIIDARMGGLQSEIYCAMSGDYEPTLVTPGEVEHEICTAKAISFNCGLISSLVANYVRLYINDALDLKRFKERTFLFDTATMFVPKD